MSECAVCGCKQSRIDLVDEVFQVDGAYVLVEGIPAKICTRCGEQAVSLKTAEAIRKAVRGGELSGRSIQMQVFDFQTIEGAKTADAAAFLD